MSNGKHHISVCDLNKIETDHNEKETKTGTAYVSSQPTLSYKQLEMKFLI